MASAYNIHVACEWNMQIQFQNRQIESFLDWEVLKFSNFETCQQIRYRQTLSAGCRLSLLVHKGVKKPNSS